MLTASLSSAQSSIKVKSLRPEQHASSLKIRRSSDFRSQQMLKFPGTAYFHSLPEFYFACLLEGDSGVIRYVPQPFKTYFKGETYIPDIYWETSDEKYVGELKGNQGLDQQLHTACETFFERAGFVFRIIANEDVLQQGIASQNWGSIVRWLITYKDVDTQLEEDTVLVRLANEGPLRYGDFIDLGDKAYSIPFGTAVQRLLYSGSIIADIDTNFFGVSTVIRLC